MKIQIKHIGRQATWIWELSGSKKKLLSEWNAGAVPFDLAPGLPAPRRPYVGKVVEGFTMGRHSIFLASPTATTLWLDDGAEKVPYPFPDDPYHPDVDLDVQPKWFRALDGDMYDVIAAEWWDGVVFRLSTLGRHLQLGSNPRQPGAPPDDTYVASVRQWCHEAAAARPEHRAVFDSVADACDKFRAGVLDGEYGNDFGIGFIALMDASRDLEDVAREAGEPVTLLSGPGRGSDVWESMARRIERAARVG